MSGQLKAIFAGLITWLEKSNANQTVTLINVLGSVSLWHSQDWLNGAPARPDDLANWLLNQSYDYQAAGETRFDIGAVADVLPFVTSLTRPEDWTIRPMRAFDRLLISGNNGQLTELNGFFQTAQFQALKIEIGSVVFCGAWAGQRALDTLQQTWNWPLEIAVHGREEQVHALAERLADYPFCAIVPLSRETSAPILVVLGDAPLLMQVIRGYAESSFAYAIATGAAKDVASLARISNAGRCAGASALNAPATSATSESLAAFLVEVVEPMAISGVTLDAAIARSSLGKHSVLYAHEAPLRETSLRFALDRLRDRLGDVAAGTKVLVNEALPMLNLQPRRYDTDELVVRLALRETGPSRSRAIELTRLFQTVRQQLPALSTRDARGFGQQTVLRRIYSEPSAAEPAYPKRAFDSERSTVQELVQPYFDPAAPRPFTVTDSTTAAEPAQARVQTEIWQNKERTLTITPGEFFAVRLWIGQPSSPVGAQADEAFPVHQIDDSADVQVLSVIYMPLVGCLADSRGQAIRTALRFSKRQGVSATLEFAAEAVPGTQNYGARILILYRNKILQSLMLTVPVDHREVTADRRPKLKVENAVKSDFSALRDGSSFDFAFVLNHNVLGQQGLTTVGKRYVDFREPAGDFANVQQRLAAELLQLNDIGVSDPEAVREQLQKSLRTLAKLGNVLREAICDGQEELVELTCSEHYDPRAPLRLQVVEAKVGAFMPLEFFYDGRAPSDDAPLCAKFQDPGFPHTTCMGCQDRGSARVICPIGFWGISKVIERRPKTAGLLPLGADYRIGEPDDSRRVLPAMTSSLYGLSKKIRPADQTLIHSLMQDQFKGKGRFAGDWESWRAWISKVAPPLLIVAGHTSIRDMLPNLEISGNTLCVSAVETDLLRAMEKPSPVVVLLGCETHYAPESLLKLSGRFKQKGAAVVIATLATIRGSQTPACLSELTRAFSDARAARKAARPDASTVGHAMLSAKQRLLSSGQSIALSLTTVGDAEWEF
jgi:hypothetical protein